LHERHYRILTTATHSLARNIKEESPYKPEEFLSGLILAFAHVFSHKERQHFAAVILAAI
jgi:hypothetical protein